MDPLKIFNDEDYAALVKARTQLGHAQTIIDKAKQCGVDCSVKEARKNELDNILSAYETHFFPGYSHTAG